MAMFLVYGLCVFAVAGLMGLTVAKATEPTTGTLAVLSLQALALGILMYLFTLEAVRL